MKILVSQVIGPGARVTADIARAAYAKLNAALPETPRYAPTGKFQRCYVNVINQIRRAGGRIVCGWMVNPHDFGPNLEAHAVWQAPSGELVEVTHDPEVGGALPFVPDPAVKQMTNCSLTLVRNDVDAEFFRRQTIVFCVMNGQIVPSFGVVENAPVVANRRGYRR